MGKNGMSTLILFEEKLVRRIWHNDTWWFSVVDVVGALTDSKNARRYWSDLKRQLAEKEGFNQLYEKIVQLKLESSDGKKYTTDCANTETLLRVIQSIPSPKAGGKIAGNARIELEQQSGAKVSTKENYKGLPESSRKQIKSSKKKIK